MFTKGDKVAVIGSWNHKETVYIERGTVHSCGSKVLRIELANGQMAKIAFDPLRNDKITCGTRLIVRDDTNEAIAAIATDAAKTFFAAERASAENRIGNTAFVQSSVIAGVEFFTNCEPVILWK